jgi:acyl-CoA thioesterase-1
MNPVVRASIVAVSLVLGASCGRTPTRAPASSEQTASRAGTSTVASAPAATYDATPAGARPRIVFLGDSLTAGLGLDRDDAVPALIQAHLDRDGYKYEVVNAGVSGDTSAGGLSRLDWSLQGDVRLLVVELGANDGLRGLPVENTRKNLDGIIRRAQSRGITVLLTGMEALPQYGPTYTSQFRQIYPDLAKQDHVALMPFYLEGVAGNPDLNQADGIHPNPAGAHIVEAHLWQALEPLLDRGPARGEGAAAHD